MKSLTWPNTRISHSPTKSTKNGLLKNHIPLQTRTFVTFREHGFNFNTSIRPKYSICVKLAIKLFLIPAYFWLLTVVLAQVMAILET